MERYDFGFVQQILTFTRVREGSLTALTSGDQHVPAVSVSR